MIVPVLLAGGSGTRLWPLSRELHPKQFLRLGSEEHSLLEQTLLRLKGLADAAPLIVAREEHRFLVAEHARRAGFGNTRILLEPIGRNTAPAVALAAHEATRMHGADALLLVLPSDHVIADTAAFVTAVAAGARAAAAGKLVTFGITPTSPETGYGYIQISGKISGKASAGAAVALERFVEKPDRATAERYLAEGGYYWNSGMFLFRGDVYLAQLAQFAPDIAEAARAAHAASEQDRDFLRVNAEKFRACRSDSIDYAVMEKTRDAVLVPLDAGWSDLGSWSSVAEIGQPDAAGNVFSGDVQAQDTERSFIHSSGRLVATLGLRDQVVIETKDAVLVADRNRVQDVKALVRTLEKAQRSEVREHRRVYRPWGYYEDLAVGPRYRVKHIQVKPGARLSLQMHHHRAEHWIVVSGTAEVTCGEKVFVLSEDQSTYIPIGEKHRLANRGKTPLELVEVQTGSYVGEDDIVRFEDVYGRTRK